MIEFKYPEERQIALHYATVLNDSIAREILERGGVRNRTEALALKDFYWAMVDRSVQDHGQGLAILEQEGIESWMEYLFHSFNGYLVSQGFEAEWDQE